MERDGIGNGPLWDGHIIDNPYARLLAPWNVPLWMLSLKLAPALAAGNTVVLSGRERITSRIRSIGSQGVVPLGQRSIGADVQLTHLGIADLDALLVGLFHQMRTHT